MPARLIVNNLFHENRNVYVFYLGYTALGEVNFLPSGSTSANAGQTSTLFMPHETCIRRAAGTCDFLRFL